MGDEIERRFLITEKPEDLFEHPSHNISQGYLVIEDQYEIRVRKKDDKFFQTIKIGNGFQREEIEIEISSQQFNKLWPLTVEKRIEKTRFEININNNVIEVDVYKNNLKGLVTAEVEFETLQEGRMFDPPDWFGPEVTENSRYNNKFLAIHGLPTIK